MKFNVLYVFWAIACYLCIWLFLRIFGNSEHTFFGTAENQGTVLNYEHKVLVKRVLVKSGAMVKKGDTLAIFYRSELERQSLEHENEIADVLLQNKNNTNALQNEILVLESKKNMLQTELQHEQQILNSESEIQQELMNLLGKEQVTPKSNLKKERIAALNEEIAALSAQIQTQKIGLQQKQSADRALATLKTRQLDERLHFLDTEQKKLVLIAPMDGFIEQVYITENTIEPELKPLVKINPTTTNRIRGFVYEDAEINSRWGDSVQIASVARPEIKCTGHFTGISPELVELPVRLRKLPEIKSWGREVYLQLPADNPFFIGEKVSIFLKPVK